MSRQPPLVAESTPRCDAVRRATSLTRPSSSTAPTCPLERFSIERGERVVRIPTHLTAGARRSARQRGKSDPIGALNVARASLREGLDSFPAAQLDGPELDLRLLVDHRERLVRHRVELNTDSTRAATATSTPPCTA